MIIIDGMNLLEMLGQKESEITRVDYLPGDVYGPDQVALTKQVGTRTWLLAYQILRRGIVTEYRLVSAVPIPVNPVWN